MRNKHKDNPNSYARVIFTLPRSLASELEEYASAIRNGNKSGFVADALRAYIDDLRKRRHTQRLRDSYAASAADSQAINRVWESLDNETWARLDRVTRSRK